MQLFIRKVSLGKPETPKLYSPAEAIHATKYGKESTKDVFMEVELVPVIKKTEGFPIDATIWRKGPFTGKVSLEQAIKNRHGINENWLYVLSAISQMELSVPIEITLDGDIYPAITIYRIGGTLFSVNGTDSVMVSPIFDIAKINMMNSSKIRTKIVEVLQYFVKIVHEKTDVRGSTYRETGKRIFHTLECLKPDEIQVVE